MTSQLHEMQTADNTRDTPHESISRRLGDTDVAEATGYGQDQAGPLPQFRRQSATPLRRPSSVGTESRPSSRASKPYLHNESSTDSLLLPRATKKDHESVEPTLWHSAPLLFAIVPAVGGVLFKSGSVFITDLALLVLAALYLNWCLVTPWIWYHSAQSVKTIDPPEVGRDQDTIVEDYLDDAVEYLAPVQEKNTTASATPPSATDAPAAYDAFNELRLHEATALALCFLGPLLGAYILHVLRSQLSTLGDQLVTNLNLTLFVLGAEIRPLRHAMKMAEARTLYLQRIVKEDPYVSSKDKDQDALLGELRGRIDDLESSYSTKLLEQSNGSKAKQPDDTEALKRLQSAMQSQIDALTRAVRRYEKRQTTSGMQTESRLQDLDTRLKDSISLAAAAANYAQRPGIVAAALSQAAYLFSLPLKATHAAVVMPLHFASTFVISLAIRTGVVRGAPSKGAPTLPPRAKSQARVGHKGR